MVKRKTTQSHEEFLFSGAIVSDTEDFLCGVGGAGKAWCQGAQAGSLSAAPFPVTERQAPSKPWPRAITQPSCQEAKESGRCPQP